MTSRAAEDREWMSILLCGGTAGVVTWASVFPLGTIALSIYMCCLFMTDLRRKMSSKQGFRPRGSITTSSSAVLILRLCCHVPRCVEELCRSPGKRIGTKDWRCFFEVLEYAVSGPSLSTRFSGLYMSGRCRYSSARIDKVSNEILLISFRHTAVQSTLITKQANCQLI